MRERPSASLNVSDFVRRPVAHAEVMRDDPRARLQRLGQDRPKSQVRGRQQVGGHDGGAGNIGLERVLQLEGDEVLDAGGLGVRVGFGDAHRIDVDAQPPRAVVSWRRSPESAHLRSPDRPRNRSFARWPGPASGRRHLAASARTAPVGEHQAASVLGRKAELARQNVKGGKKRQTSGESDHAFEHTQSLLTVRGIRG